MRFETELDACKAWIRDFNNIPGALLEMAYKRDMDALVLLAGGERRSDCCGADVTAGEAIDGFRCERCERGCDVHWSGAVYAWPAAWGTLFNPDDSFDEAWIRENADAIAATCGFLVYDCEDVGILLAVDGAGYDFFEQHWLPLYRLRGLTWHHPTSDLSAFDRRDY